MDNEIKLPLQVATLSLDERTLLMQACIEGRDDERLAVGVRDMYRDIWEKLADPSKPSASEGVEARFLILLAQCFESGSTSHLGEYHAKRLREIAKRPWATEQSEDAPFRQALESVLVEWFKSGDGDTFCGDDVIELLDELKTLLSGTHPYVQTPKQAKGPLCIYMHGNGSICRKPYEDEFHGEGFNGGHDFIVRPRHK